MSWEVFLTGLHNASSYVFQQFGRDGHLVCDDFVDFCIVKRVSKVVAFCCSRKVELTLEIHYKLIAPHLFLLKTAVIGLELHSFEFYFSYIVHMYNPYYARIRKTQGLLPIVRPSFFHSDTFFVIM